MKDHTFNIDSLHYRLATCYGPGKPRILKDGTNICSYAGAVLMGFVVSLFIVMAGVSCGIGVLSTTFWIMMRIMYGIWLPVQLAVVYTLAIVWIITFSATFIFLENRSWPKLKSWFALHHPIGIAPSFLKMAYQSWKEKTCFKIYFK